MTTTTTPTYTVGELLYKSRPDAKLDQEQLASALGVARNTISNYETGRSIPAFDLTVAWARITGVSLEWLASGVTKMAPSEDGADVRPEGFEL